MDDRIGRRAVFIGTVLNFSLATGILALTPDHGWIFLTIFRFFVGSASHSSSSGSNPMARQRPPSCSHVSANPHRQPTSAITIGSSSRSLRMDATSNAAETDGSGLIATGSVLSCRRGPGETGGLE